MFQSISWQTYFTYCLITILIYYVAIGFIYFRFEIANRLRQPLTFKKFPIDDTNNNETVDNDIPALVSGLKDELIAFVESTGSNREKPEIMFGLKKIIGKYAVLQDSPFKNEINTTITMACENNCSIILSEEETGFLWKG